ncbi:MAG: 2-amino-4-hydroxy-6-hydroxymethyldihydropteridine diphosphokinase [Pseudopedobacter saltans]|uniref:2-amino-4-hydroxy-6-hydroxymethyldihydropteridine pyrophosphokinase n=1 Tax=Pseudopedobacter saltans TaxID=151895 RepID=A0A2W5F144_9SPHI|nr:MAG: 2-amino-4-hydroxy-6-hydroxymethyldihydropteridine diphosphokinase [Pseudopedobacter saltans]
MNRAYLLIGGNMGDRKANLKRACDEIAERCGTIVAQSSIYETAAWGLEDQPDFYNQAIILDTGILPERLMQMLLDIETIMGRKRLEKMGPRIIDIDILFIEDQLFNTNILKSPHPLMAQRRFALEPLAEIASDARDPFTHKKIATLLEECTDPLEVHKIEEH